MDGASSLFGGNKGSNDGSLMSAASGSFGENTKGDIKETVLKCIGADFGLL